MVANYRAYTGRLYRILILIVYPLLALWFCYWMQSGFLHTVFEISYLGTESLLAPCICMVEILLDGLIFRGIESKKAGVSDLFLNTVKGKQFLKDVLMVDTIRRCGVITLLFTANILMGLHFGNVGALELAWSIGHLFFTMLLCFVSIWVSRFSASMFLSLFIAYAVVAAGTMLQEFIGWPIYLAWYEILPAVIGCLIVGICIVRTPLKRLEESFYDKE